MWGLGGFQGKAARPELSRCRQRTARASADFTETGIEPAQAIHSLTGALASCKGWHSTSTSTGSFAAAPQIPVQRATEA
jgi:hypothetical protein